jgi:predicted ribosomally synthesized peptide with SipW-like signal peptide
MADDNSDSKVTLSRRKALAGIGSIGLAGALGVGGTYAQFTDTEGQTATFSAGGIDGTLVTNASYNGEQLNGQENPGYVTYDGEEAGATIHFEDVKPGDYGSFNFTLEVTNNPAWVGSCLGIDSDTDGQEFEPESKYEEDGIGMQSGETSKSFGQQNSDETDIYGSEGPGELAENLWVIPFYDSDATSQFFDSGGAPSNFNPQTGQGVPSDFWSNSEDSEHSTSTGDGYLAPRTLRDVVENVSALNTKVWNDDSWDVCEAPEGSSIDLGCVLLDGEMNSGENSSDNTRSVNPLQPGTEMHFGYDWHIPFEAGNELQGDSVKVNVGFVFNQLRHSKSPQLQNTYAPGNYTPSVSESE